MSQGCGLAASGAVRCPTAEIRGLRSELAGWPDPAAAAGVKLADEQAVLGMVAVLRAADAAGWRGRSFADWGVIAAPRFLGRCRGAQALARYSNQGPRSVSPLVIPYLSLHSVAGCVSLGLHAHGPNFGVGGGPGHVSEGLTAAFDTLVANRLPGAWLVLTGWDPEPIPDDSGNTTAAAIGYGLALALVPRSSPQASGSMCVRYPGAPGDDDPPLRGLVEQLLDGRPWTCAVAGGGSIELVPPSSVPQAVSAAA